jgi:16S rRNA (cytosine967-C5)-methyltransferase
MHPNALLEHATELVHRVLRFQQPADAEVAAYFREQRSLGPRERHLLADTAYTVLRQLPRLRHLARSGRGELDRRLAVLGWQGNEGLLRAALDEGEREWLAQARSVDPATLPEALRHNLAPWLAEALQAALGEEEFRALVESLAAPAPLDLRVNSLKARREAAQEALATLGIESAPTPYSPLGLRVAGKPALHRLEPFMRGDVEVQDEGSQLLALLVGARRGEMVVDFCAGAGGKTLALGAEMRNTGRLYAFDTSGHRLAALKPRLARSGLSNVHPVQIAHENDERIKRLAGKIDRVLVDAPCSGLGTLRRSPDLQWRQTPETIAELRARQAAILAGAARLVKPGGRLVYATCSLLESEGEHIARDFSAAHARDFEPLPAVAALQPARVADAGSLVEGEHLRLWPHRHRTDGFFAALWERRA